DGWMRQLKADKKLVIQAAGASQRAADLILGTEFNEVADSAGGSQPNSKRTTETSVKPEIAVAPSGQAEDSCSHSPKGGQLDLF
ncbi:MAG: hypothetical protein KDA45_07265, partial [Planctomycetales bacterium]|nr:hypothetical protein [Planctomycetales bacterium]